VSGGSAGSRGHLPANIEESRRDTRLALIRKQINSIDKTRAARLAQAADTGPHAMVLARAIGIGVKTADMPVRSCRGTPPGRQAFEPVISRTVHCGQFSCAPFAAPTQ
jgi:hypothetical protein